MNNHSDQHTEQYEPTIGQMASILRGLIVRARFYWLLEHHSRTSILALFSCATGCISIGLMSLLAYLTNSPFIFPSLGPTAFLFFYRPFAAAASPRNTLIGHTIGVCAGYLSLVITGLTGAGPALTVGVTESRIIAATISLGLTAGLMILLHAPHPPAGATTLIVSLGILTQPWQLLLLMAAVVLLTCQAIVINRLAGIPYPLWAPSLHVRGFESRENVRMQSDEKHARDRSQRDALPANATPFSHILYQTAQRLAKLCPPRLGQEIDLTGSVSHGVSDEHSDIEIIFLVDSMPSTDEREKWLHQVGAEDIISDLEPIEDGSIWTSCRFQGIWVEAGWKTIAAHEEQLRAILAGEVIEHTRLALAEITVHAIPLRTEGILAKWQQELSHYPDILQQKLIANATELWMFPHIVAARRTLIQRGEQLPLAERLVRDIHNVLRILFAINREWEPGWKWIQASTQRLRVQPDQLVERINEVFAVPQPEQSLAICTQLIYDTLLLVPAPYDVTRVLATIQESL